MLNHPTAEEVYEYISERYPNISKGTIYRNLTLMTEKGEAMKIPVPGGADHYDFRTDSHYHGRCECCGRVVDVECDASLIDSFEDDAAAKSGFHVQGHEMIFKGICSDCYSKMNIAG